MIPSNFNQAAFQSKIDRITGTKDGRPLIKLAWAPDELRWMPHKLGDDPEGYTFPIFCTGKNEQGEFVAPERWVLLERIEPEQFAHTWEAKRYVNWRGSVYDVKGPCPSEKYVELRCHAYHDEVCCPCVGDECKCGEKYNHCWGRYAEPDEHLLNWIRQTAWEARQDSDVKPTESEQTFTAPNAQQELMNRFRQREEKKQETADEAWRHIESTFIRQPHSVSSGLILPRTYQDESGAVHTLWEDKDGNGHAQIDFTI